MILSKTTTYGIRSLAYLSRHPNQICTLREIAKQLGIPPIYLGKILRELCRQRLVDSAKGVHGGYKLKRDPGTITFLDVFSILEPNPYMDLCILGHGICEPSNACSMHLDWQELRRQIVQFLQTRKITDVTEQRINL